MRQRLIHIGVLAASVLVTLGAAELLLRWRYAEAVRTPSEDVRAIQAYLQLHPELGFTWRENVSADEGVVFNVQDVEFEPLSTDAGGFINPPEAIRRRNAGERPRVIGVGDSFMEHAAHVFYELFAAEDIFYYNLAIHRQAPPQYTHVVGSIAAPLQPQWIIYGIFENDFAEMEDYDRWKKSGLDWFAFHSGTWCGPPLSTTPAGRLYKQHLRGFDGLFRVIRTRVRGERMSVRGPSDKSVDRVIELTVEAAGAARGAGAGFLVLLIPSRATVTEGRTAEARAYDTLIAEFQKSGIPFIDFRAVFSGHPSPASLYYEQDGHWNRHGIEAAGAVILEFITRESGG